MPEELWRISLEIEMDALVWLYLDKIKIGSFNVYIYENVSVQALQQLEAFSGDWFKNP